MTAFDASAYYQAHYPASADEWRQWHAEGKWPSAESLQPAAAFPPGSGRGVVYHLLLPYAPFQRTLDIGCSAGDFILPIKALSQESHGLDISPFPGAWEILRAKYGVSCQLLDIDKGDLPFPDGHFSAVTMIMALEHVFDVAHATAEIARVLAPGGVAVIQVPNLAYVKRRVDLMLGRLPVTADHSDPHFERSWDGQHLHSFTQDALAMLVKRHKLEPVACKCFGRLARWRSLWPSLLGADLTMLVRKAKT